MSADVSKERLWEVVQDVQICMMATKDGDCMRARPMRGRADVEGNAIWFMTEIPSAKEAEVTSDPQACLTYADVKSHNYVSLSGTIEVVTDEERVRAYWNDSVAAYFAKPYHEKAALLRFTPTMGEYWDSPGNPLIIAIRFVEAAVTGKRPDLGTNEKIDMG